MNNTTKNLKDEIEGIVGDFLWLETQAFTTGAVTQQYVKWDDLFTQLFDTGKQITSLIEQEKERAIEEFHNFVRSNTIGGRFMDDGGGYFNADAVLREDIEQYLAERKE